MKIKASYIDVLLIFATIIAGLINTHVCQIMFCIMFLFVGIHLTFSRETLKSIRNWLLEVHEDDQIK